MENRVYQVKEVNRVLLVTQEIMVLMVQMVLKDRKENRVILDQLDRKAYLDPQENRVDQVKMEPWVPQVHRVRLDPQDLQDLLVRVAQGETKVPLVHLGQEVHKDDRESEASQDRWDPLENRVPRDSVVHQALWVQLDCPEQMEA